MLLSRDILCLQLVHFFLYLKLFLNRNFDQFFFLWKQSPIHTLHINEFCFQKSYFLTKLLFNRNLFPHQSNFLFKFLITVHKQTISFLQLMINHHKILFRLVNLSQLILQADHLLSKSRALSCTCFDFVTHISEWFHELLVVLDLWLEGLFVGAGVGECWVVVLGLFGESWEI